MTILAQPAHVIAEAVHDGTLSAVDVVAATQAAIERNDPAINAFSEVTYERALSEALRVDAARRAREPLGPLAGVPYAVKNLFDIEGLTTLAGSRINAGHPPAAGDATVIKRLKGAGALLFGALNMGEYAYDFTGENAHYGATRNPHNKAHMSGGSSGGSAAAVAAGLVPLALGSDTNGSIRVPSALTGIFGLKPTFGRLSRAGCFPFCASLDHVGPFAGTVRDLALTMDVLQGPDSADPVCATRIPQAVSAHLARGAEGVTLAIADDYFQRGLHPDAAAAVQRVAAALDVERSVHLPQVARARAAAFLMTNIEAGNLHLARLKTRAADFDPDVRERLLAGALAPASWYVQAQRFRRWYQAAVRAVFDDVDVIIAPATPCSAPRIGQKTMTLDGETLPVRPNLGLFTQPISFIGLPVVTVPVNSPGQLPVGVQLIAPAWRDDLCLRVAATLETLGFTASLATKEGK